MDAIVTNLRFIITSGVAGLCVLILYKSFKLVESTTILDTSKTRLTYAVMRLSVVVLIISSTVELTKFLTEKRLNHASYVEGLNTGRHMALEDLAAISPDDFGDLFDPQPSKTDASRYLYRGMRAPSGLKAITKNEDIFQDFSTDYILQRLWADPRSPKSWIHAQTVATPTSMGRTQGKALRVDFSRQGWGCDIALKGMHNCALDVQKYDKLVLYLQADPTSSQELARLGRTLAFRVRIVDGRDNHWAWGKVYEKKNKDRSIEYNTKDTRNIEMSLTSSEISEFEFDLSDRKRWGWFRSDGGVAPIDPEISHFRFLQFVVLELGVSPTEGELRVLANEEGHRRFLGVTPEKPCTVLVHGIKLK